MVSLHGLPSVCKLHLSLFKSKIHVLHINTVNRAKKSDIGTRGLKEKMSSGFGKIVDPGVI